MAAEKLAEKSIEIKRVGIGNTAALGPDFTTLRNAFRLNEFWLI
jgi:hypothetical protein